MACLYYEKPKRVQVVVQWHWRKTETILRLLYESRRHIFFLFTHTIRGDPMAKIEQQQQMPTMRQQIHQSSPSLVMISTCRWAVTNVGTRYCHDPYPPTAWYRHTSQTFLATLAQSPVVRATTTMAIDASIGAASFPRLNECCIWKCRDIHPVSVGYLLQ